MRRLFYSDDDFGGLFRDKLTNHKVTPSSAVWDRIETQLNGQKPPKRNGYVRLLLGIVCATIGILYLFNQATITQQAITQKNKTSIKTTFVATEPSASDKQINTISSDYFYIPTQTPLSQYSSTYSALQQVNQSSDILQVLRQPNALSPLSKKADVFSSITYKSENAAVISNTSIFNITHNNHNNIIVQSDKDNTCNRGIFAGISVAYGNYWLLTNSFQNNPNVTASFSPVREIRGQLGFKLNKRWAMESGITYQFAQVNYRSINQNKRMQTSTMVDNAIRLQFVQMPLTFRYNLIGDCNRTLELTAGYKFSKYMKAQTILNEAAFDIATDEIKPYQHAISLGLETGFKFSRKMAARYGFDATCNTSMLSTPVSERINDLYRPIPLTLSAHLGIVFNK